MEICAYYWRMKSVYHQCFQLCVTMTDIMFDVNFSKYCDENVPQSSNFLAEIESYLMNVIKGLYLVIYFIIYLV